MNYPPHVLRLKNEFEQRASRNKNYSLRAYARDLGVSPAALSSLLNLKKGISEKKAHELAERLELTKAEKEFFLLSVASQHSRSPQRRQGAIEKIQKVRTREKRQQKIPTETFAQIQNWYSLALLELMELEACTHQVSWFAEKLSLSPLVIKNALERLMQSQMIEYKHGKYRALSEESVTEEDIPSSEIKNFHSEMIKKADQALFTESVSEREFLNMTFAFPTGEMDEAKQMIREFQMAFAERFYNQTKKKKNSVYQLSVQFFRIDAKGKQK